jgi:dolichol-phosphate mannosyltransferase
VLLGNPVRDIDCALKIFHRDQLPAILPESNNFFANTEMLSRARQANLSVAEVGVHHRPRAAGHSKVSWGDIPKTLSALFPYWWSQHLFPAKEGDRKPLGLRMCFALLFLALLAGFLLFHNLSYPLMEPDEGRYAEISREMAASGDWIVPTLNHQPYLDKPPLVYWLVAGALKLLGNEEWVARLVPALATFLTIFVIFGFGRRIVGNRAAFLAAFAFTIMAGVVLCGRALLLDSVLTLFVVLALFTAYEAGSGRRLKWAWWLTSGFFCGLGILVKGPVALVLVAPPVMACSWLDRRRTRPGLKHWAAYLVLLGVVAGPWFVAVCLRCPQFAYHFLVDHHLFRFFTGEYHSNPVWYYLPVLFLGCSPFSFLLFPLARFLFLRNREARCLRQPGMGFFLLWVLWCVAFFSLSAGKLPPYILPALPALALLVGSYLEIVLFKENLAHLVAAACGIVPRLSVILLAGGWLLFLFWSWSVEEFDPLRYPLGVAEAILCCAGILTIVCFGRNPRVSWALCSLLVVGLLLEITNGFVPTWSARRSPVARLPEVELHIQEKATGVVCLQQDYWGSVPFRLDRDHAFFHAAGRPPHEVKAFLLRHGHNLIIGSQEWDEERTRSFLPPELEIVKVIDSGRARFFLIEPNTSQVWKN